MIENIVFEEKNQKLEEFYQRYTHFSYSAINTLLWNPRVFYRKYVELEEEDSQSEQLIIGKCIHTLILTPEKFEDFFMVSPTNLPTGNTKIVIDKVFKHHKLLCELDGQYTVTPVQITDYEDTILDILKEIDLHQSLTDDKVKPGETGRTGDQKRLDKILTEESINYWNFLINSFKKDVIDLNTYNYCLGAANTIKEDPELSSLLGLDITEFTADREVYNEVYLESGLKDYEFGVKGIVDNYVINHTDKIITINDLKTTTKELIKFSDSVDTFRYWLQAAIYMCLVFKKHEDLIEQGYDIRFNFLVIDSNYMTYVFPVKPATMDYWVTKTLDVFKRVHYHYENKKYELPYELCNKLISL